MTIVYNLLARFGAWRLDGFDSKILWYTGYIKIIKEKKKKQYGGYLPQIQITTWQIGTLQPEQWDELNFKDFVGFIII